MKIIFYILLSIVFSIEAGCANQQISSTDPVNTALKICGLGIDAKAADVYRVAYNVASRKGDLSFEATASDAINTQTMVLLKQANLKSDSSLKTAVAEIKSTRSCVLSEMALLQPPTRSDLLEQCRKDVQRKISPPGMATFGTLRFWNQKNGELSHADIVPMTGIVDTGGSSSYRINALCDIRNDRFNESVIQR